MILKMDFFEVRIRLTELNFFNTTYRIELFFLKMTFFRHWTFFWIRLKELKFSNTTQRIPLSLIWLKVLNFFLNDSLNWTFFSRNMTWLIELNLFLWTSFLKMTQRVEVFLSDSKNWNVSSQNVSKNLTSLSCELFIHDPKNLTLFLNMIQRIEPCLNMINTQRIEPFIIWLKELSFFLIWRNALNFFLVCRKELSLILNMAPRIELVFLM